MAKIYIPSIILHICIGEHYPEIVNKNTLVFVSPVKDIGAL